MLLRRSLHPRDVFIYIHIYVYEFIHILWVYSHRELTSGHSLLVTTSNIQEEKPMIPLLKNPFLRFPNIALHSEVWYFSRPLEATCHANAYTHNKADTLTKTKRPVLCGGVQWKRFS